MKAGDKHATATTNNNYLLFSLSIDDNIYILSFSLNPIHFIILL